MKKIAIIFFVIVFTFALGDYSRAWSIVFAQGSPPENALFEKIPIVAYAYSPPEQALFEEIPVVISASKMEQPISEAPCSISVITADDIKYSGATDLADVLRIVPGISVVRFSPSDVSVTARGFNEPGVRDMLVMIDGRTIYNDFFGLVLWDMMSTPLEIIDRVEIIRGPVSALYGPNAFSGYINIITKKPEDLKGTYLSNTVGTVYDNYKSTFYHADTKDKVGYRATYGHNEAHHFPNSAGYYGRNDDDFRTNDATVFIDYDLDNGGYFSFDTGSIEATGETLTGLSEFERDGEETYAKFNYNIGNWKLQTFTRHIDVDLWVNKNSLAMDHERLRSNTSDISLEHNYSLNEKNTIVWGGGFRYVDVYSRAVFRDRETSRNVSFFLQDEYKFKDNFIITTGGRLDSQPVEGVVFQPRISAVYLPHEKHTIRTSVSQSVRQPALVDLFLNIPIYHPTITGLQIGLAHGLKDLEPERVTNYEIGYDLRLLDNRFNISSSLYYEKIDHRIVFYTYGTANRTFRNNHEGADVIGGELSLDAKLSEEWSCFINYSGIKPSGDNFKYTPENKANTGFRYVKKNGRLKGFSTNMTLSWVDQTDVTDVLLATRTDSLPAPSTSVKAYTVANLRLGYEFNIGKTKAETAISILNLNNQQHREYPGAEELDQVVLGTISFKF